MGCILIRLHSRLRTNMVVFFALSLALLHFVKHNSCRSYIETWGGLLPVQVSLTLNQNLKCTSSKEGCLTYTVLGIPTSTLSGLFQDIRWSWSFGSLHVLRYCPPACFLPDEERWPAGAERLEALGQCD